MSLAVSEGVAESTTMDAAAMRSIVSGIMLAMFLSVMEQTIVAPALPTIGARLGNIHALPWVGSAYLLAATVATPLLSKLSDIYGRRSILLSGVGIFIAGSVACALAPSMWALIAARAVQGIGGGSIMPISFAIIADLVSPRERARYQSQMAVMLTAATVAGPLIGGVLTDYLHWSLIFWINLPMGALALAIASRPLALLPRNEHGRALDWPGAGLMVLATLALMLAMTWAGITYPWTSWPIAALISSSMLLWLLFAWRIMTATEPFVPPEVLSKCAGTVVASFFSIGTLSGLSFFMPLYLQLSLRTTAMMSGVALIAGTGGVVLGTLVAGKTLARHRHYKRMPLTGLVVAIASLTVLAAVQHPPFVAIIVLFALIGAGIGPMYPVTTVIVQSAAPRQQVGIATGTLNFFRLLGGTIVVASFGAIVLAGGSGGLTLPGVMAHGPAAGIAFTPADHALADFSAVFSWVFAAAALCLAVALSALLMVKEHPLRGPERTEPGDQ